MGSNFVQMVKQSKIRLRYLIENKSKFSDSQIMLINRSFFSAQVIVDYIACQMSLPAKSKDLHFRGNFKKGVSKTFNSFLKLEESKNVSGLMFTCSGR
jgi:hypothetical protein